MRPIVALSISDLEMVGLDGLVTRSQGTFRVEPVVVGSPTREDDQHEGVGRDYGGRGHDLVGPIILRVNLCCLRASSGPRSASMSSGARDRLRPRRR